MKTHHKINLVFSLIPLMACSDLGSTFDLSSRISVKGALTDTSFLAGIYQCEDSSLSVTIYGDSTCLLSYNSHSEKLFFWIVPRDKSWGKENDTLSTDFYDRYGVAFDFSEISVPTKYKNLFPPRYLPDGSRQEFKGLISSQNTFEIEKNSAIGQMPNAAIRYDLVTSTVGVDDDGNVISVGSIETHVRLERIS